MPKRARAVISNRRCTPTGAGSVVTKDIPAGCVAVGNPCRVIREISERDREFYYRERRIPAHFFETEE